MKYAIRLLLFVALGAALAQPPGGQAAARHDLSLGVAGRTNEAASIAALGRVVVVAWGATKPGGSTDVYIARSRDGGGVFGAPVRVNDVEGDASVGGEQPPHVALMPRASGEPSIAVVWTAKRKEGTRILISRSEDGGATFGKASPLPGGEAAGNRGWEAIAADRDGQIVAVWLDHRDMAAGAGSAPMHHEGHDHAAAGTTPVDGAVRAQLSKLYFARLQTGAAAGEPPARAVAAGVCYCCKTAIAAGLDGAIYAAWRHVYPGNIRDIAFTMSRDGGRTFSEPLRVSDDRWVLDGCPENGPAMTVDGRQRVHLVWPTLVNGASSGAEPSLDLFYASSNDGRGFTARRRLPSEGLPRHARIASAPDGSLAIVWEEQAGGTRRIVVARPRGDQFTREVVSQARAVYPAVVFAGQSTVVAWASEATDRSVIQVARLDH